MTTDDATLQALLGSHPPCPMFILGKGPRFDDPETQPQQWEHARHMVDRLRDGSLAIVCAIFGDTDVLGIAIAPLEKAKPTCARCWKRILPSKRDGFQCGWHRR